MVHYQTINTYLGYTVYVKLKTKGLQPPEITINDPLACNEVYIMSVLTRIHIIFGKRKMYFVVVIKADLLIKRKNKEAIPLGSFKMFSKCSCYL